VSALRLVLFDCDGTLVDSAGHIVAAMQGAFRAHDLAPPPADKVRAIIGLSLPLAVAALAQDADALLAADLVCAYKAAYRDATAGGAAGEPLFDGVPEMLHAVGAGPSLLGIATGKSRAGLARILLSHGLESRFATTVTADDAASKPAPDMVYRALAETGADAARTVVIGDSGFDMAMARAAGALAIGVAWGYQPPERLEAAGALAIARTTRDIPLLVDRLVSP